ncbi:BgTH12-06237 [Blumeria graminis f. sp. triticale]|uniref:BgTH12-06237 n=1 Tax=Blumeria graminis f. sp. triticale TaxID=1689686 RepID=A0A9W4GCI1_BLUGR|nr:BgTH12-06237 [Blumeria graminis f. sp. triticale]
MKFFCLTFISIFFSFLASVNASMYFHCPSEALILYDDVMQRAQEMYLKVRLFDANTQLGQNTVDDITISGSVESGDLSYTGPFFPYFQTSHKYSIFINGITTDMYLSETTGSSTQDCTMGPPESHPPSNRVSDWTSLGG